MFELDLKQQQQQWSEAKAISMNSYAFNFLLLLRMEQLAGGAAVINTIQNVEWIYECMHAWMQRECSSSKSTWVLLSKIRQSNERFNRTKSHFKFQLNFQKFVSLRVIR